MKFLCRTFLILSFLFCVEQNYSAMSYSSANLNTSNQQQSIENNKLKDYNPQILHDFIDFRFLWILLGLY